MRLNLFPFQKKATADLRMKVAEAIGSYRRTHTPQVVSLQAPTGSGKTIIMASLIEDIYFGTSQYAEQPEAIFVWLSDSPELNEQSKQKIDLKADKIRLQQCITIADESFDMEMLEDGHIYFLNTQKLGRAGNLGRHSDNRQYTIWETLANTAREKSDRLYFIIDEAHRGMQGREAGIATSIMQRFLKGYAPLHFPAMPLVIGISATAERFNTLVGDTASTLQKCVITANEVRASGLLKDRIVVTYPDDPERNNDIAVLQAATVEWKNKCEHWYQYCQEQHYSQVNPVFVIQVLAGSGRALSDTNLEDVIAKVEECIGSPFKEHEVVHTFGSCGTVSVNGLAIHHVDPSEIVEDRRIKIVLFKENLSTGWDCPRAETMMSFRRAEDSTYIAQLLGRMVRTPLQSHINVDDSLNEVRLYLPYFNRETVKKVIDELRNTEGGDIPVVVDGESLEHQVYVPWSVHVPHPHRAPAENPDQLELFPATLQNSNEGMDSFAGNATREIAPQQVPTPMMPLPTRTQDSAPATGDITTGSQPQLPLPIGMLDREGITKFINGMGLLTYLVRSVRISNYLDSLLRLASLLTQTNIFAQANDVVEADVVRMIREHVEYLHSSGKYDEQAKQVLSFKLSVRIFDVFGESLDNGIAHNLLAASESDLDRQLRAADAKLGAAGFPFKYGRVYGDIDNPSEYKIDCILFAADDDCIARLNHYAEDKFHWLDDTYRRRIIATSDRCKKDYSDIIANGDTVSKHNFCLPETISVRMDEDGKEYTNHLFADEFGISKIKLNTWESGVLEEEMNATDFVCWVRNPSRASWALCIPYESNGETKPMYPDFIVVRRDPVLEYVIDILEPHSPDFSDNLGKAKGLARYAKEEQRIGRVQLIRKGLDAAGNLRFKRLDLAKGAIRDKVLRAQTSDELDHIFDADGIFA